MNWKVKTKLSLLLIFLFVAVAVVVKTTSQSLNQSGSRQLKELEEKEKRQSLTIKESVELAKIRGKKQVTAPSFVSLQPIAQSPEELESLLPRYSIILAEVVDKFGYLKDPGRITSWYKFRTIDVVPSASPAILCRASDSRRVTRAQRWRILRSLGRGRRHSGRNRSYSK